MQLGRHRKSKLLSASTHAAAPSAARAGGRRRTMTLVLGLACGLALAAVASVSVASAAPSYLSQIDSLEAQAEELQAQIDELDQQLEASTEAFNQLVVHLDELNVEMIDLRTQQEMAEREYRYRLRLYEDRLCDLYKAGGRDEFLEMILDAADADDFLSRARLAAELAEQDRRLMANLTRSADQLKAILAEVDQAKSQQLVVRKQMNDERDRISTTLATRESTLAGVDAEIAALWEAERQRQAEEQARLRQTLAAMLNGGQVYNGILPQADSEILNQFLQTAAAYIGIPYVWGGDRPSTGMDCSGYTQYVYKQHGVKLPHYSGYQAVMGLPVDRANIMPGDLLAFGFPVHHVGIYIGQDLFLHAAGTGKDVRIGRLSERTDVAAIRRFGLTPRDGDPDFH